MIQFEHASEFSQPEWLRYGFGLKDSEIDWTMIDDGFIEKAKRQTVLDAKRSILEQNRDIEAVHLVTQRHTDRVAIVSPGDTPDAIGLLEADALITGRKNIAMGIKTADCLPILLFDCKTRFVGAVHAGWRGTVSGIVFRTIKIMCDHFECKPNDMTAIMGPCARVERYEVGVDVAEEFEQVGLNKAIVSKPGEKPHIDLIAANRLHLEKSGVTEIHTAGGCTLDENNADRYDSWRRSGGKCGRMVSWIAALDR